MRITRWILLRHAALQIVVSLLALTGSLHAAGAVAGPPVDSGSSATVRYSDLDLSQPEAVGVLYRRIETAALRVCRASITYLYLETAPARQECHRQTVADTVSRINLSALTAWHREQTAAR